MADCSKRSAGLDSTTCSLASEVLPAWQVLSSASSVGMALGSSCVMMMCVRELGGVRLDSAATAAGERR